ncbi:MAG: ABC transporter ATP-binding protein [Candidatus Bathyarchaeota archaeon]|nr:ABC transporter ATP-binding protein [Candidatus Bathyarchaeota archaeon]
MDALEVKNLSVKVEGKLILKNISFSLKQGVSHILFGPNGSGKTTLISALMGLPGYEVISGQVFFMGKDITNTTVEERANLGIVVSFQNPPEITGVKLGELLKLCLGKDASYEFTSEEKRQIEAFRLTSFLDRDINVGFSGGEKKRSEILQLIFLKPKLLLLDEPDSGVDVESLRLIADEIQRYTESSGASALIITHKGDILEHVNAGYGCILLEGQFHCFTEPTSIYKDIKKLGYEGCVACRVRKIEGWKSERNGQNQ